jgi:hypothetical protein
VPGDANSGYLLTRSQKDVLFLASDTANYISGANLA